MKSSLIVCAVLALFIAFVHAWMGSRKVLRPVLGANLHPVVRGTMEAAWHLLTWHFVLLGVLFGYGAIAGGYAARLAAVIGGAHALGFATIFLVVAHRTGSILRLPQWTLFAPMAVLAISTPFLETARIPGLGQLAATVAAVVLVALALLHVAWASGSTWPARDRSELARLVVGVEVNRGMPGRGATIAVAVGLMGAAASVLAVRGLVAVPVGVFALAFVTWALVAIFALRGVGGFFEQALRPGIRGTPYARWNVRLYSPVSLALALGIGIAAAAP